MLEHVIQTTESYLSSKTKIERKKIGQFFTSKQTAVFMANMFSIPESSSISILDPGAGSGILATALIDRLQQYNHISRIQLTCYENDESILELLKANLDYVKDTSIIEIEYRIHVENYISSQYDDFNRTIFFNEERERYDLIIANPPYKKISKDAIEATSMSCVCYGAPNLYFLFAAMSLFNLRDGGEMVYIVPRSWTSGAYFKAFREYLLSNGKLISMHLFVSRDKVFEQESVLQETIIIKIRRQHENVNSIEISSSHSNSDFDEVTCIHAPYPNIVSEPEKYVFLITNDQEVRVLKQLRQFTYTLPSLGIRMKTGLTVDFRNRDFLRNVPDVNVVPLFNSQHIKNGQVIFPLNKENEYIVTDQPGLLQRNKNYLFVKRFTAKEEKRRLQCGIYLSSSFPDYSIISTQNKVNFIDSIDDTSLSENMVYGLYVLFNSTIYDTYYRTLNGSTQVNSTEINAMPVPSEIVIEEMGRRIRDSKELSVRKCDQILQEVMK